LNNPMTEELETPAQREWRAMLVVGAYIVQFVLVYLAVFAWGLFAGSVGMNETRGGFWAGATFQICNGLWIGVLGFLLGLGVQSCIRGAARTGRWVWVPLTLALLWGIPWDYIRFGWHEVVSDWFFWFNPGQEEGPAGKALITDPTWASIWYTVGLQVVSRRKRLSPGGHNPATSTSSSAAS
jgi:hypothetical protein